MSLCDDWMCESRLSADGSTMLQRWQNHSIPVGAGTMAMLIGSIHSAGAMALCCEAV